MRFRTDSGFVRPLIGFERALIGILWLTWIVYWIAAARQTAANWRKESLPTGASYRIPLLIGIMLMVSSRASLAGNGFDLWSLNPLILGIAVILTVVGLSFAVWARLHLGKYWSGQITLKVDHRVIQTGPYARVRHPIYSGLILALLGTAISLGTVRAFLGFAFLLVSFLRKLTLEENWLRSHFGTEYELYQKRVRALIPHP
jgi:protein-S-isoprenylcysteine O-methyltransferase Ste14